MIIWKYELLPEGKTAINLIAGWEILAIRVQNGTAMLWAKMPIEGEPEEVNIVVRTAGRVYAEKSVWSEIYLGTFELLNGLHVGHVFLVDDAEEELK